MNLFSLEGKTALITGGSRGLGRQMAEGFLSVGASVVLTARKADELAQAAADLSQIGSGKVHVVDCDLSKLDTMSAIVDRILAAAGSIDILVNNAGTSWVAPMEDHPLEGWNKVMALNVTAPFLLTQEIGKRCFIPARAGKIINIASIGGLGGNRSDTEMYTIAYNTSKAAMINFTRALATEWGRYNINVNALCPGFFPSKMSAELIERLSEQTLPSIPLGRFGSEGDLNGAAIFMASAASRHITGQVLAVDGGATA